MDQVSKDETSAGAHPPARVLQVERHDYVDLAPTDRPRAQSLHGFDPVYTDIVDYIVRCTHRIWDERDVGLIYTHYTHNAVMYTALGALYDRESVVRDTIQRLTELPDRRGMATQVIWRGNDVDGFYTSHLVTGSGRHTEPGLWGAATQRRFVARGVADCLIFENRIYREWLTRDNMAIVRQLGLDADRVAAAHATAAAERGLTVAALAENGRVLGQGQPGEADESIAHTDGEAHCLRWMHHVYNKRMFGAIRDQYASNVQWHGTQMRELYGVGAVMTETLRLVGMIPDGYLVPQHICSVPSNEGGEKIAVRWVMQGHHLGHGVIGAPSGKPLTVLGFTHFHVVDGKIRDEWVVYDELALLTQVKLAEMLG